MAMKIIDTVPLSEGQIGFQLVSWPTEEDHAVFHKWVRKCGITNHVIIKPFYRAEMFGDIDYPAIQILKGAPKSVKTLCLLKWS